MNSFSPIYDKHAISEVAIFFEFTRHFTNDDISNLEDLKRILYKDLPVHDDIFTIEMRFSGKEDQKSQPQIPDKAGFELKKFSYLEDDSRKLDWMLRVTDKTISVHCLEYVRWDGFINKASEYFVKAFKKINLSGNEFKSVVLKYIDKFKYSGTDENYDITELFASDNTYIAPYVLANADCRWHNHIGWFESYSEDIEILNQVSIDAARTGTNADSSHITTIDHNAILKRKGEQIALPLAMPIDNGDDNFKSLIDALDFLHDLNKSVIGNMLSSNMKKKIHLNEK